VASVCLDRNDFEALDCTGENAQNIVNLPRSVQGVEVSLFVYAPPGAQHTKVSVRTVPPYDAATLCSGFGGGGHARAAGCEFGTAPSDALDKVLQRVHAMWYGGA
jgi:bifunctional oligoribonuclease and PAP phosphatase NrnA